ncbi:MAG: polyphenol oxidase family protein [Gemmatimonadales bacterium]
MEAETLVLEVPAGDLSVPRLELPDWATRFGLTAGITTREGGFSLGLSSDDPAGQVMTRWGTFRRAFQPRFPSVVVSQQVHGTDVRWHNGVPSGWLLLDAVDGHGTRQAGVLLTITVADCIPVYLAAPASGVMLLLHAGWRGVAGGILERTLHDIEKEASVSMGELVMHCGVGICGNCYEVGSEVVERLAGSSGKGQTHVDLRAILAARATALGVGTVTVSAYCTAHHNDRFFSHRASGGRDGRMVAYLGRPLA